MATVDPDFVFTNGNTRYPWHQWLDGQVWVLKKGEDYDIQTLSMRVQCHARAEKRGLKARVRASGDTIWVQAYKPEED
jgi:hypothetical protein